MAKQKQKNEVEIMLAGLFDLRQELKAVNRRKKEIEEAIADVQGVGLALAQKKGVKKLEAGPFVGEVASRGNIAIDPGALLEYLEEHNKMHMAPVLMSVLGGRVKQYLGQDVREALGTKETIEYHKLNVTRQVN